MKGEGGEREREKMTDNQLSFKGVCVYPFNFSFLMPRG